MRTHSLIRPDEEHQNDANKANRNEAAKRQTHMNEQMTSDPRTSSLRIQEADQQRLNIEFGRRSVAVAIAIIISLF
eukprot:677354-Pleurochrysis_carterae.AAC.5